MYYYCCINYTVKRTLIGMLNYIFLAAMEMQTSLTRPVINT